MTNPAALIGSTLGSYELQTLLGSGGMASVYRGLDQNLQRPVAVKVISAALATDQNYLDRFRREAQLIANLRHPNVVQVYAFGEHQGLLYMVQELLPGPTLEQRLADLCQSGQLMVRQDVLAIVQDLAAALDAAHAVGVIHRDVKPGNAIANAQGHMVLTDFGIARSAVDTTQTAAGVLMGTPGYVAPEQAVSSAALTPACDIYALGVLAFELLTGRRPFEADTPTGVVLKHLYEAPPAPSSRRPELPPDLDAAVLRALEKEPTARFSSAGAFAQALADAWPDSAPIAAPSPSASSPPATVHSQQTSVWAGRPAPVAPATQAPAQAIAPVTAAPPVSSGRPRWLLPLLGAGLLLILAAGALLASRGQGNAITDAPTAAATVVPTEALSPAAATSPPATAEPTAPMPIASDAAAEVTAPIDPVAELRTLLEAGRDDGRAGESVGFLLERQAQLEEAVAAGDAKKVEEQLREMRNKISEQVREGKMEAAFGNEVSAALEQVAAAQ